MTVRGQTHQSLASVFVRDFVHKAWLVLFHEIVSRVSRCVFPDSLGPPLGGLHHSDQKRVAKKI